MLTHALHTCLQSLLQSTSKNLDFLWLGSLLASVFLLFITIANIYGIISPCISPNGSVTGCTALFCFRFTSGIKRYGFEEQVDRATLVRQRGNDRKERISERKNGLAKKAPKKKQRDLYYDMHL
jgi:hypothetical protein